MRRNASWAFAGNAVYASSQWFVFVLLIRSLGQAEVGVFAYALALAGPVFVLANVRLRSLLATGAPASQPFTDFLAARLLTTGVAVSALLVIGALVAPRPGSLTVVALIACARACDAVSDICHGLFQRELDMRSATIGLVVNSGVSVLLVALSVALSPSLTLATAGYAAGSCLALVGWDLPRAGRLAGRSKPGRTPHSAIASGLRLITTALPLGLSSAIGSVQTNLPRYVITAYLGPAALAVFAAISYLPMVGHLVVNATAQAALPLLARDAQASRQQYRTRLRALVASSVVFGALGLAATVVLARPVLRVVYGEPYTQYDGVLLWLVVAAIVTFTSVFLGTGTTARLRFGAQPIVSATSLVVVAGSIGPLVNRYGLHGAAWSLLAGAVVELVAYAALTVRDLRVDGPAPAIASSALAGGVQS